ncbi:type IX secretion system membrane protein PorP/SprF [Mucilaginibacter panaciglaebae]
MKRHILLLLLSALSTNNSFAQQTIQLSQYLFNGLAVNPAYAGYKDNWTINASSRLQWAGVDGAPITNTLSVDGITDPEYKNVALGLLITNDRLGPENNSAVYANYCYRIRLNNEDSQRLCFGVGIGAIVYNIDGTKFNTGNTTDPAISSAIQNKLAPDFRAGVYYYSPSFYVGGSVLNLIPNAYPDPNSIFIHEVTTYYLTAGVMVNVSPVIDWKPSFLIKEDFKGPTNVSAATNFLFSNLIWAGASYSTSVELWKKPNLQSDLVRMDAITGMVGINITPLFRFGYSYDFGSSKIPGYPSASHEISLTYSFARAKGRILSPRYF